MELTTMPSILVTGANGQLGSEIQALHVEHPEWQFYFTDRDTLDIADKDAIALTCNQHNITHIINCAAYTAVDKAESEPKLCNAINHIAVRHLAEVAKENAISLIHVSTDYVFNGTNYRPYVETDPTDPQGVYGASKLKGEEALLHVSPKQSLIIRTSWVYSSFGANFVKTMLRLGKERESLNVIFDQVGTPTYARHLAQAILTILPRISNTTPEIYHFSNEGVCSWYDFAHEIMRMTKLTCKVNPITIEQYPTPASRPHYSLLNKAKIKNDFEIEIPYWKEGLDHCLRTIGKREKNRFDTWNSLKKQLHQVNKPIGFNQQDILFMSLGQNIGFESYGKGDEFMRPVIVLKKFGTYSFLGVPLTSKSKEGNHFMTVTFKDRVNTAMLNQIRTFDAKRIKYKIGYLGKKQYEALKIKITEQLTPLHDEGGAHKGENQYNYNKIQKMGQGEGK